MFYKFLKFLFLSTLTLVWGGCENADDTVAGYGCNSIRCYNTTAVTKSGKVYDIIKCDDGLKYPRHAVFQDSEFMEITINTEPPRIAELEIGDECGIINCKYIESDICYESEVRDSTGNRNFAKICTPIIDCPEKK